jgi:hypothetical protein
MVHGVELWCGYVLSRPATGMKVPGSYLWLSHRVKGQEAPAFYKAIPGGTHNIKQTNKRRGKQYVMNMFKSPYLWLFPINEISTGCFKTRKICTCTFVDCTNALH